jgi:hypothetical protein
VGDGHLEKAGDTMAALAAAIRIDGLLWGGAAKTAPTRILASIHHRPRVLGGIRFGGRNGCEDRAGGILDEPETC